MEITEDLSSLQGDEDGRKAAALTSTFGGSSSGRRASIRNCLGGGKSKRSFTGSFFIVWLDPIRFIWVLTLKSFNRSLYRFILFFSYRKVQVDAILVIESFIELVTLSVRILFL